MIKRYNQFVNEKESTEIPPTKEDQFIEVGSEDLNLIKSTPVLSRLVSGHKITIDDNKIFYNDETTKIILDEYFK